MHILQGLSDQILVNRHQDPISRAFVHVHLRVLRSLYAHGDLHLTLETNTIAGQSSSAQIDGTLRRLC